MKYEEIDSELLDIIHRCFLDRFKSKVKYVMIFSLVSMTVLGALIALGFVQLDSEMATRFKILPFIIGGSLIGLRNADLAHAKNMRYVIMPVYSVASSELVLRQQDLSQLFFLCIQQQAMNL